MRPSYMMAWAQVLGEFAIDLSCLKHPSFFEEKEFRAIRALIHSEGKFLDVGAGSRGDAVSVKARTRGSNEIAYIEFPIDANHEGTVVRNVIIGPRNDAALDMVKSRIQKAGFRDFLVKRSSTTYR